MGCGYSSPRSSNTAAPEEGSYIASVAEMVAAEERNARFRLIADYRDMVESFHPLTPVTLAEHCTENSLWIAIDTAVHDCTKWQHEHPGGAKTIQRQGGKDATELFVRLHSKETRARVTSNGFATYLGRMCWSPSWSVWECFAGAYDGDPQPWLSMEALRRQETQRRFVIVEEYFKGLVYCHPLSKENIKLSGGRLTVDDGGRVYEARDGSTAPVVVGALGHVHVPTSVLDEACRNLFDSDSVGYSSPASSDDKPGVHEMNASELGSLNPAEYRQFRIAAVDLLTKDIASITVSIANDPQFVPGGHISVEVPLGNLPCVYRPYTPVDVSAGLIRLIVKRYPDGVGSTFLHSRRAGDEIRILGPLPPKYKMDGTRRPKRLVLLGAGTGGAPLLSIARAAVAEGYSRDETVLVLCFRTLADAVLTTEARALADDGQRRAATVKVVELYTRENPSIANPPSTRVGRISASILSDVIGDAASVDDDCVICGPAGFNDAARSAAASFGISDARITVMD